ncbi:MAG TPA: oligosaccharide flippase family protein [Candidatus Saccharimonadales bacterium]|nr:oligosaccharide flippase family protein [Candidatus Saccharimonadales bacterium]
MNIFTRARSSHFVRHNSIFFVGAALVGALNYLYYPVMGRLLPTTAFGEVQTLISLFLQITIFLSVLSLVTINVVANYESDAQRNMVVVEFEKLATLISIGVLVLTLVFERAVTHFFHFASIGPFLLLMLALIASVPFTFRGAFLRGKRRFGLASTANVVSAAAKLLFAVVFVWFGPSTDGAIVGLIAAQLLAWAIAAICATRAGLELPASYRWSRWPNIRLLLPELRYGALVLVGSLVVTLQYSLDIIVVKHYFSPHVAGVYAGVASVARIIFFLTMSIALVMMSLVRLQAEPRANRRILRYSLLLTTAVGLPLVILSALDPSRVIDLLMGGAYVASAALLPKLSLAIFVVALLNVCVSYYLALRKYAVAPALLVGAALTYGLMYAHHASLAEIVNNVCIGSVTMLGIVVIWMYGVRKREML